jgi:hypothetical protein
VRVIQRREHARLALEARQPVTIAGDRGGQDLDCNLPLEPRVERAIHLAHAARAKGAADLIRAELLARTQHLRGAVIAVGLVRRDREELVAAGKDSS